jgi:hypothetical protein
MSSSGFEPTFPKPPLKPYSLERWANRIGLNIVIYKLYERLYLPITTIQPHRQTTDNYDVCCYRHMSGPLQA